MRTRPHTHESQSLSPARPFTWDTDSLQQKTPTVHKHRASYPIASFKICEAQVFPKIRSPSSPIEDPAIGYSDMFNYARPGEGPGHWREGLRSPHNPETKMQLRVKDTISDFTNEHVNLSHMPFLEDSQHLQFLDMGENGTFSISDKAKLDLKTLADWLDDSRPTDPSGAYAMLLIAKDLIRRLLSGSVNIWNSSEDSVRQSLNEANDQLAATRMELQDEKKMRADLALKVDEAINSAAAHEVTNRKELLHTQIRLDKTKADLDYAWVQLNTARQQIENLQEENAEIRRCIEDSIWNPDRMNDLLMFISELDHYVRFRMLQTLLLCEAEQGRMLEFVRSLDEDLGKDITETIVDAFVLHKLENSEDPMELLRDLAQQRLQVLGQQGRRRNLKAANMWNIPSAMAKTKAAELARKEKQKLLDEQEQAEKDNDWNRPISRTPSGVKAETVEAETQTDSTGQPSAHPGGGRFAMIARNAIAGIRAGSPFGVRLGAAPAEPEDESPEGHHRGRRGSVLLNTKKTVKKPKSKSNDISVVTISKLIPQIYEDKVLRDLIDVREGRRAMPLTEFVKDFFSRRYGLAGLAAKHYKELVEQLSKYKDHSQRISHFARNLGIGTEENSAFVSEFYCRCLARLIPQEIISERMSAKECTVDFEVAVQCIDHMLPANTALAASPSLRARLLELTKIGKKFQPVIDIDEFMHHIMLEFLRLSGRSNGSQAASAEPSPENSPRSQNDPASRRNSRRGSIGEGRGERRGSMVKKERRGSLVIPEDTGTAKKERRGSIVIPEDADTA